MPPPPPSGYDFIPPLATIRRNRATGFGMVPYASGGIECEVGAPLPTDGAIVQYWLDQDRLDRSGGGRDLTLVAGSQGYGPIEIVPANVTQAYNGYGAYDGDGTGELDFADAPGDLRFLNEVTVQCMAMVPSLGAARPAIVYGGDGGGGTSASNWAYRIDFTNLGDHPQPRFRWQHGANVDVDVTDTVAMELGEWYLITGVRRDDGATCTGELWIDDQLIVSTAGLTKPTGATSDGLNVFYNGVFEHYVGGLGQIRIWGSARAASDIEADARCVAPLRRYTA